MFDYHEFLEELKEHSEADKQNLYQKFIKHSNGLLKDEDFYKDYVAKFHVLDYQVPDELVFDFDWDLLLRFVSASLSSDYHFDFLNGLYCPVEDRVIPKLVIHVSNSSQTIEKPIDLLYSFQISRLFEIYIEESINHFLLLKEMTVDEQISFLKEKEERIRLNNEIVKDYYESEKIFRLLLRSNH